MEAFVAVVAAAVVVAVAADAAVVSVGTAAVVAESLFVVSAVAAIVLQLVSVQLYLKNNVNMLYYLARQTVELKRLAEFLFLLQCTISSKFATQTTDYMSKHLCNIPVG